MAANQVTAQKNQWELDKLQTQSEMLKKFMIDEVDSHSKEGAYIIGLSMQGARWDHNSVSIEKSKVCSFVTLIVNASGNRCYLIILCAESGFPVVDAGMVMVVLVLVLVKPSSCSSCHSEKM